MLNNTRPHRHSLYGQTIFFSVRFGLKHIRVSKWFKFCLSESFFYWSNPICQSNCFGIREFKASAELSMDAEGPNGTQRVCWEGEQMVDVHVDMLSLQKNSSALPPCLPSALMFSTGFCLRTNRERRPKCQNMGFYAVAAWTKCVYMMPCQVKTRPMRFVSLLSIACASC